MRITSGSTAIAWLACSAFVAPGEEPLDEIPNRLLTGEADESRLALFEVDGDRFVVKHVRDDEAGKLGLLCWERIKRLIPLKPARRSFSSTSSQDGVGPTASAATA